MQDADFQWFIDNMRDLFKQYGPSFLVISDKKVRGKYDTYADGVRAARMQFAPGTFIVQECGDSEAAYTNYIASMNFMPASKVEALA